MGMSPSADVKSTSTFNRGLEAKRMRPTISSGKGKTTSRNVVQLSDGAPKGNHTIAFYTLFCLQKKDLQWVNIGVQLNLPLAMRQLKRSR